jgi:hypothetical protein
MPVTDAPRGLRWDLVAVGLTATAVVDWWSRLRSTRGGGGRCAKKQPGAGPRKKPGAARRKKLRVAPKKKLRVAPKKKRRVSPRKKPGAAPSKKPGDAPKKLMLQSAWRMKQGAWQRRFASRKPLESPLG